MGGIGGILSPGFGLRVDAGASAGFGDDSMENESGLVAYLVADGGSEGS